MSVMQAVMYARFARQATSLALVLGVVGSACILFVDSNTGALGRTCGIQGENTACGKCIATNCQPKLDACCSDESCRPLLDTVDTCATDFTNPACPSLQPASGAPTNADLGLRACVWSTCADTCRASSGAFITSCSNGYDGCYCTLDAPPNATVCAAGSLGEGFCCADRNWPSSGSSCACHPFACETTGAGCRCGSDVAGTTTSCTGTYCCLQNVIGACSCSSTPCSSAALQVVSCTPDTALCDNSGMVHVAACSVKATQPDASPPISPSCTVAADKESCACSHGSASGTTACNTAALSGQSSLCCASAGWSSGTSDGTCRCDRVRCYADSIQGSCSCEVNPQIPENTTSCAATTANTCCLEDTGKACYCDTGSCQSGFSMLGFGTTNCDPSQLTCPTGTARVSSCNGP